MTDKERINQLEHENNVLRGRIENLRLRCHESARDYFDSGCMYGAIVICSKSLFEKLIDCKNKDAPTV